MGVGGGRRGGRWTGTWKGGGVMQVKYYAPSQLRTAVLTTAVFQYLSFIAVLTTLFVDYTVCPIPLLLTIPFAFYSTCLLFHSLNISFVLPT